MRNQFLAAGTVFAVLCFGPLAFAQSSGEGSSAKPSPSTTTGSDRGVSKFLEGLPQETRERFLAAREKALEDPKLQELHLKAQRAKKEFFKAMRSKMLAIDPELADIVKKRSVERKANKAWGEEGGLGGLSDDERQKLLSVMEQVDSDPAVEAANQKRWEASSADERKSTLENYRKALRDAMAKVDPTIAPILDKLGPSAQPARSRAAQDDR